MIEMREILHEAHLSLANPESHQRSLEHIVMSYPFYKQAITQGKSEKKKQGEAKSAKG